MFLVLSKFNGNQKHLIFKETFWVDPEKIFFGVIFFSLSTETDASLLLQFTGSAMYSLISVGTNSDLLMIMRILLFTHFQDRVHEFVPRVTVLCGMFMTLWKSWKF